MDLKQTIGIYHLEDHYLVKIWIFERTFVFQWSLAEWKVVVLSLVEVKKKELEREETSSNNAN